MLSKRTKFSCSWVLENHVGFIRLNSILYIKVVPQSRSIGKLFSKV
jgi:hypothetical protein